MRRVLSSAGVLFAVLAAAGICLAVEGDVTMKRAGQQAGIAPAVFPHWIHRIRYRCYACHEGLFKMGKGANAVSMEAISQGKFCGACHDGKTAWGSNFETCTRCHLKQ